MCDDPLWQASVYESHRGRTYFADDYKFSQGTYWVISRQSKGDVMWLGVLQPEEDEVVRFLARDMTGHPHPWMSTRADVIATWKLEFSQPGVLDPATVGNKRVAGIACARRPSTTAPRPWLRELAHMQCTSL